MPLKQLDITYNMPGRYIFVYILLATNAIEICMQSINLHALQFGILADGRLQQKLNVAAELPLFASAVSKLMRKLNIA